MLDSSVQAALLTLTIKMFLSFDFWALLFFLSSDVYSGLRISRLSTLKTPEEAKKHSVPLMNLAA